MRPAVSAELHISISPPVSLLLVTSHRISVFPVILLLLTSLRNGQNDIMRQPGIFGQLIWNCYTVGLLGFRTTPDGSRESITAKLDHAALTLLDAFPFLSGQVIKEGRSSRNSRTYRIVPYHPHEGKSPVRVKDCSDWCPSYDEIMQANAPFSMLDGDIFCPMKGMGYQYDEKTVQPVFIRTGKFHRWWLAFVLCFHAPGSRHERSSRPHSTFCRCCKCGELDPEILAMGHRVADTIVPPLKSGEVALEHEGFRQPSSLTPSAPPPQHLGNTGDFAVTS